MVATSVAEITDKNKLYRQFLVKTFELQNISPIRAGEVVYYSDTQPEFWVNGLKVEQKVTAGQLNRLDLTGYLKKGANSLMAIFPAKTGENAFSANTSVLHQNFDKTDFSDSTWLIIDRYVRPKQRCEIILKKPQILKERSIPK